MIRRNAFHEEAPSRRAASSYSSGMPPSAAPNSSIGKPTHCQTLIRITTGSAVSGWPSQGWDIDSSPTESNSAFSAPNCGRSISTHR